MEKYKFVTQEDIHKAWDEPGQQAIFHLAKRLLAERGAYREVAIQNSYQGVNIETSSVITLVDAEAARILEKK